MSLPPPRGTASWLDLAAISGLPRSPRSGAVEVGPSQRGPCPAVQKIPSAPSPSGSCWPLRLPGTQYLQLCCCAKGRVPGGEGSQPAATVKDLDCLPLKRTRKKLPLDLVFPDAQPMTVIAVAWQIPLLLVNTLLFDSRGRTTGSWSVW